MRGILNYDCDRKPLIRIVAVVQVVAIVVLVVVDIKVIGIIPVWIPIARPRIH